MSEPNCRQKKLEKEDILLRDFLNSSVVDVSKIDHGPPYPLVWDKDFNFVGHKVFGDIKGDE